MHICTIILQLTDLHFCMSLFGMSGRKLCVGVCVGTRERERERETERERVREKLYPVLECDNMDQVHLCLFSGHPEIWQESENGQLPKAWLSWVGALLLRDKWTQTTRCRHTLTHTHSQRRKPIQFRSVRHFSLNGGRLIYSFRWIVHLKLWRMCRRECVCVCVSVCASFPDDACHWWSLLQAALVIKRKTKQCGEPFNTGRCGSWGDDTSSAVLLPTLTSQRGVP